MNGLSIAKVEVNRKMLSELAIDNPDAFQSLVNTAKEALKSGKKAEKKVESIKEVAPKKEEKTSKTDYSKMNLTELKALAKEQGIKGYSTMKKDELLNNLK